MSHVQPCPGLRNNGRSCNHCCRTLSSSMQRRTLGPTPKCVAMTSCKVRAANNLAGHTASRTVEAGLRDGDAVFVHLDDIYVVALPERIRELYSAVLAKQRLFSFLHNPQRGPSAKGDTRAEVKATYGDLRWGVVRQSLRGDRSGGKPLHRHWQWQQVAKRVGWPHRIGQRRRQAARTIAWRAQMRLLPVWQREQREPEIGRAVGRKSLLKAITRRSGGKGAAPP